MYHDQVGFIPDMQGWTNIQTLFNLIHHINRAKEEKSMIISIEAKTISKTQHPLIMISLSKLGI